MALSINTQDLENYPGTTKRITVDITSLVPTGFEGDEQIMVSVTTTAYSNVTSRTAIQDMYLTNFKTGWCKSTGFAGTNGKFLLASGTNSLLIKIDETTGGTAGYYPISLAYEATPITGESIAQDMEEKIRAITLDTVDAGFELSYINAAVEFSDGKFKIVSGSISDQYTGSGRSSVKVLPGTTNDCSAILGFNNTVDTETLASQTVKEVSLASNYTADEPTMTIAAGTGIQAYDCVMISDRSNTEYFTALSGTTDTLVVVPTSSGNGYMGVQNNYSTVSGTRVQLMRQQDPDSEPASYYDSIDKIVRFGIKSIVNQIDFSG